MSTSLPIPNILRIDKARELNNLVYKNTGCVLFLTTPKDPNYHLPPPISSRECFLYNVLNLYKIYYDFTGGYFLWVCLQDKQLPSNPDISAPTDFDQRLREIRSSRIDVIKHYAFIKENARHILTHGIFYDISVNGYIDPKIDSYMNWCKGVIGKEKPSNEDWDYMAEYLKDQADQLYLWIKEWAELWSFCNSTKPEMQNRFYNAKWNKENRKCEYVRDKRLAELSPDELYIPFDDSPGSNISSFSRVFSSQMINDCKESLAIVGRGAHTYPDNEEKLKYWLAVRPNSYWHILCKQINFFGIDPVREALTGPNRTTEECPDLYRIYLNGLFNAITRLPTGNVNTNNGRYFSKRR